MKNLRLYSEGFTLILPWLAFLLQLFDKLKSEFFVRILYNGIMNALTFENQPQKLNLPQ